MPRKLRPKNLKRRFKRKARRALPRVGIPYSLTTVLRYVDYKALSPGNAGVLDTLVYSLNGLYDPDITGTGHQPRGFDQLCGADNGAGLYHHYCVLGAKITVEFANKDASYVNRCFMGIADSSSAISSLLFYEEASKSRCRSVGVLGSGKDIVTMPMKWSAKKWFAKPSVITERDLVGSNTSNPVEQAYLHISVGNPQNVDSGAVDVVVKIDYIVRFTVPLTPAVS